MTEPARRRYPGPLSFQDDDIDRLLFQGRSGDGTRLLHLTLAEDLVVLYAKSGAGKTSLINTRLLQPLRDRRFFPVIARVRDEHTSPGDAIRAAVRETARESKLEIVDGPSTSLFAFFRTLEIWRSDILLTPVLILDQLEELFTVRTPQVRDAFALELAALLGRSGSAAGAGLPAPEDLDQGRAAVKIVLSLREDSIGELEEFSEFVPDILRHRFRIGPLSEEEAGAAIVEPARLVSPLLATPPFEWKSDTVKRLIEFLHHRRLAGKVYTSRHVEPFQLQLICQHVEDLVVDRHRRQQPVTAIDYDADIGGDAGARRIMRTFYETKLAALGSRYPLRRLRRLCEHGLITDAGRRAMLDDDTIKRKYNLGSDALEALSHSHLIRVEPRGDEKRYELSHDTLVSPILEVREERRLRRRNAMASVSAATLVVLTLVAYSGTRSDAFQEWAAVREGVAETQKLRGDGDDLIRSWSLALAWNGDVPRARGSADAIEAPETRTVALTQLTGVFAQHDATRAAAADILRQTHRIARRISATGERVRRLIAVATAAESLGLPDLAGQAWGDVGGSMEIPQGGFSLLGAVLARRDEGTPSSPGVDSALDRLTGAAMDWLESGSLPPDGEADEVAAIAVGLLPVVPEAQIAPLTAALRSFVAKSPDSYNRAQTLVQSASIVMDRAAPELALPLIDQAVVLLASPLPPDRLTLVVAERLMLMARVARLLHFSGDASRASAAADRCRSFAATHAAGLLPYSLFLAAQTLKGTGNTATSPALDRAAAALAAMAIDRGTQPDAVLDIADVEFVTESAREFAGHGAAVALLDRLPLWPYVKANAAARLHWLNGDQVAALRSLDELPADQQAIPLLRLAHSEGKDGRPLVDRAVEAIRKTSDPSSRGDAVAMTIFWLEQFAPEAFDLVLPFVTEERSALARLPMLAALTTAANNPRLAEGVAAIVRELGPMTVPAALAPSAAAPIPSEVQERTEPRDLTQERLGRLSVMESLLVAIAGNRAEGLVQDIFDLALTETRRLEGSDRSQWLGRLGVVAARGGRLAEARALAREAADSAQRLTVLSALVAVRAGQRRPEARGRIYDELLPFSVRATPRPAAY